MTKMSANATLTDSVSSTTSPSTNTCGSKSGLKTATCFNGGCTNHTDCTPNWIYVCILGTRYSTLYDDDMISATVIGGSAARTSSCDQSGFLKYQTGTSGVVEGSVARVSSPPTTYSVPTCSLQRILQLRLHQEVIVTRQGFPALPFVILLQPRFWWWCMCHCHPPCYGLTGPFDQVFQPPDSYGYCTRD